MAEQSQEIESEDNTDMGLISSYARFDLTASQVSGPQIARGAVCSQELKSMFEGENGRLKPLLGRR